MLAAIARVARTSAAPLTIDKPDVRRTLPILGLALAVLAGVSVAVADEAVTVSTDAADYAPTADVVATVTNGTPAPISPSGGLVCRGSAWPFGVQQFADDGTWHDVSDPRTPPCAGIAAARLLPGESETRTLQASSDAGEFRLVYTYQAADGSNASAVSDPFFVEAE